ncbi:MAG: hypothetical protein ABEJ68_02740 [Halobacteriaceae archaeon]
MTYSSADYALLAKRGFLVGATLLLVGAGGEILGHALYGSLPAWESTLFTDMEILGILIGLFAPFVFGVAAPLMD